VEVLNKGIAFERPKAFGKISKQIETAVSLNGTPPPVWKRLSPWLIGVVIGIAIGGIAVGGSLFTYYQREREQWQSNLEPDERYEQEWRENENIYNEAWKCFDAKDFTGAEKRFTRLIGLKHRESASYWARAVVRSRVGEVESALKDYNQSIRLDGRNAGVFNNRGLLLWQNGFLEDAQRDFERAIELDPANKLAHQNKNAVSLALQSNVSPRPKASLSDGNHQMRKGKSMAVIQAQHR
jgi:tetratricopeptide (TPR) repeat protein